MQGAFWCTCWIGWFGKVHEDAPYGTGKVPHPRGLRAAKQLPADEAYANESLGGADDIHEGRVVIKLHTSALGGTSDVGRVQVRCDCRGRLARVTHNVYAGILLRISIPSVLRHDFGTLQ